MFAIESYIVKYTYKTYIKLMNIGEFDLYQLVHAEKNEPSWAGKASYPGSLPVVVSHRYVLSSLIWEIKLALFDLRCESLVHVDNGRWTFFSWTFQKSIFHSI